MGLGLGSNARVSPVVSIRARLGTADFDFDLAQISLELLAELLQHAGAEEAVELEVDGAVGCGDVEGAAQEAEQLGLFGDRAGEELGPEYGEVAELFEGSADLLVELFFDELDVIDGG